MKSRPPRLSLACLALLGAASLAAAQNAQREPAAAPRARTTERAAQATADEDFELNITERRITEADYEASTEVEAGGEGGRGLSLRVGVMVRAGEIDVLLRNVRGRVRFRATLEPVLQLIRRAGPARATPAPGDASPP